MASILKSLSDFSHVEIPSGKAFKIGIVVAQWNAEITGALYHGAWSALLKNGVLEENICSVQVPGSFELSSGADILLSSKMLDAVICLPLFVMLLQTDLSMFQLNITNLSSLAYLLQIISNRQRTDQEESMGIKVKRQQSLQL
jgi:hypothetical protein